MSFVCLWSPSWSTAGERAEGEERELEPALRNPALQDDYTSEKGKRARKRWGEHEPEASSPRGGEARAESSSRASRPGGAIVGQAPDPRPAAGAPRVLAHDILASCLTHSPRVRVDARGRLWADARGLDAGALAVALLDVAVRAGVSDARAGAACTAIAAELAATGGKEEEGEPTLLVVRQGTDRAYLAPFPVAVLEPSPLVAALLDGIGVATCGELAALDAASVEVRLGAEGMRLWRLARADDPRPVFGAPHRPLPSAAAEWTEYALRDPERLQFVVNALLGTVCTALAGRGLRARELALDFALVNRARVVHTLRASRPTASQPTLLRMTRAMLERITLPDAVVGIELRVARATGNDAAQGDLFDRGFASAPAVESALALLADDQPDVAARPRNDAHPLVDARTTWVAEPPSRVVEGEGEEARLRRIGRVVEPRLTLQLVAPPRKVRVTTAPRRDHRVPVRYRDAGRWWTIVDAAGPDRVSGGHWDAPYAREYFRCVREDGVLVWLFRGARAGTGDRGQGTEDTVTVPRPSSPVPVSWFLQGWWD